MSDGQGTASCEARLAYEAQYQHAIENQLGNAINALFDQQPDDPFGFLARYLQTVSKHGAKEKFLYQAKIKRARERAEKSAPPAHFENWSVSRWVADRLVEPVAAALLAPLGSNPPPTAHVTLSFMRELGRDRGAVRALLDEAVLDRLADVVCEAASEFDDAQCPDAIAATASNKFAATTFTLSYGGLESFFSGLEGAIGPPNPDLSNSMECEHTKAADSADFFTTSNYGVQTTSAIEWQYVVEPQGGLASLGLDCWPRELEALLPEERRRGAMGALPLSAFEAEHARINAELSALHEPTILLEELISGRLYTGPLYHKYNLVLRAASESAPQILRDAFADECKGNQYSTTLHILNSCIVKLSKLSFVCKVYRGLANGVLPDSFWHADSYGVRGGVEAAFMSTTRDRDVATSYACGGSGGIILELEQGMCNRGADLTWLSQYPHEAEVLFAPLTGIEMKSTRVEGSTIVAEMAVSVNLTSPTIDQVVSKMKNAFLQILTLVAEQLTHEAKAVPSVSSAELLAPLRTLRAAAEDIEGAEFNDAAFFNAAIDATLSIQFQVLGAIERHKFEQTCAARDASAEDASAATTRHAQLTAHLDEMLHAAEQRWRYRVVDKGESPLAAAKPIIRRANALASAYVEVYEGDDRAKLRAIQARALQHRSIAQLIFSSKDVRAVRDCAIDNDLQQVLSICGELKLRPQEADALNSLGMLRQKQAKYDAARQHFGHSLAIRRELAEAADAEDAVTQPPIAQSLVSLANLSIEQGDAATQAGDAEGAQALFDGAWPYFEEAVTAYTRGFHEDHHPKVAWALEGLGKLHERRLQPADALAAYEKALRNRRHAQQQDAGSQGFSAEIEKLAAKCVELRERMPRLAMNIGHARDVMVESIRPTGQPCSPPPPE